MATPNNSNKDNSERVLGKLEEFREWAKDRFEDIEKEFKAIRAEIEILNRIKWQIYGGTAIVSVSFAIILELLKHIVWPKA